MLGRSVRLRSFGGAIHEPCPGFTVQRHLLSVASRTPTRAASTVSAHWFFSTMTSATDGSRGSGAACMTLRMLSRSSRLAAFCFSIFARTCSREAATSARHCCVSSCQNFF
ncbi:hypothetical protein DT87_31040 [Streptomyces sp. NTK 937]|nr:hypothetical protein DT87_31040 [Streptomyces sp. NTK 937]